MAFILNIVTFMQLSFSCMTSLYFFIHFIKTIGKIFSVSHFQKARYAFLTGCVQFNNHFIKWLTKLWRAPGSLSLLPSFSDSLICLRRALVIYCVLPLRIYILFSASPPAPGEISSLSNGRLKVWLSNEMNPYVFWLLMMGSWIAARDHLALLTSRLPVPFLCQRKWDFFLVLLALHFCMRLNFLFLQSWVFFNS